MPPNDVAETPARRRPRRIGRIRRMWQLVIGAVVVLALMGGGWVVIDHWHALAKRCPGLDGTSGEGFELVKTDEQCIGWIVEHDYSFDSKDQAVVSVISTITAENRRVRDQFITGERKPYVRVGVLMPMTSAPGSALNADAILHALQGAYAAQMYANDPSSTELGDTTPLIQLVLANEGLKQDFWPVVVDQLGRLKGGEHPLVAVTGLGASISETRVAAEKLSELEIPTIGASLTADDMVAPWLFKMSPSTHQSALSLKDFLDKQPDVKSGYLIYDRNDDNYVHSLKNAFIETFDSTYGLTRHSGGFNGSTSPETATPLLFAQRVNDICTLNPDIVFYAGRARDLGVLVNALGGRGRCQKIRPLVIASVGTGQITTPEDPDGTKLMEKLDMANIGLLRASYTDSEAWRMDAPGTPTDYANFHAHFTDPTDGGGLGFAEADLADGNAIMHRDAVTAAVWAARRGASDKEEYNNNRGTSPPISVLPTSRDVRDTLFSLESNRIPGASGAVFFKEQPPNDRWPSGKPVPVIRIGAIVAQWTSPDTYVTE